MQPIEHLALAALGHDLPALLEIAGVSPSLAAQQLLAGLPVAGTPILAGLLAQAEAYAMPGGSSPELGLNQPLQSIFSRVQRRDGVKQGVALGHAAEVRAAAHTIKSSSNDFGATRLAELCQTLEDMGKAGALEGAAELAAQVEAEYEPVKAALEAEREA